MSRAAARIDVSAIAYSGAKPGNRFDYVSTRELVSLTNSVNGRDGNVIADNAIDLLQPILDGLGGRFLVGERSGEGPLDWYYECSTGENECALGDGPCE